MNPPKADRPAAVSYKLSGPIQNQARNVVRNWLMVAPDNNPAMLEMFLDRDKEPPRELLPWSGEFAGKYLTASVQMLRLTGDKTLRAKIQTFVSQLVALQGPDGYLGPFPKNLRLEATPNATWDAWNQYHVMYGLMLWHDESGNAKALQCAERIGNLLCDHFLGKGSGVAGMGNPDQNQAVVHGLARLYEKTGTKRYLDLAEQVVGEFALPGAGDYLRTALQGQEFYATPKPRWESLHAIMGLAQLHGITGKDEYRRAFEHIWWSIAKLDRHNNGGFSSGEAAVGNPYNGAAIETCCTVAWLALSVEMLRTTGSSIVADEMELSTLNSVVGAHSPDGKWSTYNTPMNGKRIASTRDIAFQIRPGSEELNCCSVNAARGFGLISDWGLMTQAASGKTPAAILLNWYGPSTIATTLGANKITLEQTTKYPREGRIALTVKPQKTAKFALKLRVPYWSENTKISVNGRDVKAKAGTYCTLNREWKSGDTVEIELDMRLRAWVGEREEAGRASFYRGPLLLAYQSPSGRSRLRPDSSWQVIGTMPGVGNLYASQEKDAAFEADFEGTDIKWFGQLFNDAGKARVLVDGKMVALVDQYGPVRHAPFSWEQSGFAPGKHTLRIEVSGEKSEASLGTWMNVSGFGKPGDARPQSSDDLGAPLDFARWDAQPNERAAQKLGALAVVDLTDANGTTVRLRDFATSGQNGVSYWSWLPAKGLARTRFSKSNPLRSAVVPQP